MARVTAIARPDAPYELTDDQAAIWRQVVDAEEAEFFPQSVWPDLMAYCRHVASSQMISTQIDKMERQKRVNLDRYDKLLKLRERENRSANALARSLRITNQSRYDKSKARSAKTSNGVIDWS